ncbi:hypothetical protein TSMEX_011161 [Taenia solium]|eukprot:TsM_000750600 transcript=TsM_000750600 gene=TsM_000750600
MALLMPQDTNGGILCFALMEKHTGSCEMQIQKSSSYAPGKTKKARLARVNQAKSVASHSYLHSPSQSTDSMNAASTLSVNPLVIRFMKSLSSLPLPSPTEVREKALKPVKSEDSLSTTSPSRITTPLPTTINYHRAVTAAVNYVRHISTDEETQILLVHLLFCLEQAVTSFEGLTDVQPARKRKLFAQMEPRETYLVPDYKTAVF